MPDQIQIAENANIGEYFFFLHLEQAFESVLEEILSTHFSPINLLFSPFEEYICLRNTGVAACASFCSLSVKLSRNQSWENLLKVESPIKDRTCFISYTEFSNKSQCKSCPLAFSGIIAMLKTITERFKENINSLETVEVESFTKAFQKTKKPSNLTYRNLVATKSEKPRASQTKWYRDCDLNEEEIHWKKAFQLTRTCTKSTKIIIFQFKFLHRRLPTIPFCIRSQLKILIFAPL